MPCPRFSLLSRERGQAHAKAAAINTVVRKTTFRNVFITKSSAYGVTPTPEAFLIPDRFFPQRPKSTFFARNYSKIDAIRSASVGRVVGCV